MKKNHLVSMEWLFVFGSFLKWAWEMRRLRIFFEILVYNYENSSLVGTTRNITPSFYQTH